MTEPLGAQALSVSNRVAADNAAVADRGPRNLNYGYPAQRVFAVGLSVAALSAHALTLRRRLGRSALADLSPRPTASARNFPV